MTDQIILEWIKETCDAYCIPKPLAIIEALEVARDTAPSDARDAARAIAQRFTLDTEPERRANLQRAIEDAISAAIESPRSGTLLDGE